MLIKNDEGSYLFLKRSAPLSSEKVSSWDIPGGRIDPDESLHAALTREVAEEINFTLQNKPKLLAAQDIFVNSKSLHVVRLTYSACEDVSDVTLSDEHEDYT